jgi:hypothetical protein
MDDRSIKNGRCESVLPRKCGGRLAVRAIAFALGGIFLTLARCSGRGQGEGLFGTESEDNSPHPNPLLEHRKRGLAADAIALDRRVAIAGRRRARSRRSPMGINSMAWTKMTRWKDFEAGSDRMQREKRDDVS